MLDENSIRVEGLDDTGNVRIEDLKQEQNEENVEAVESEQPKSEQDDTENEPEESASEEENQAPKKEKGNKLKERFDKLTKQRTALETELAAEREARLELERRLNGNKEPEITNSNDGKPLADNFDTYADYLEALADWKAEQKFAQREQKAAEERARNEMIEQQKRISQKFDDARSEIEDFDEVFDPDIDISMAMRQAMFESDIPGHLAYYLSKNPEEASSIAAMSPTKAAMQMARIEQKILSAKSPKEPEKTTNDVSKAPEPIKPVRQGSSGSTKNPEDMSHKEFTAWYKKTYG